MWQNKNKALTFSFDDGVKQDIRLVEILNKYGLKGTFNLNSGFLQTPGATKKDKPRCGRRQPSFHFRRSDERFYVS